MKEKRTGNFLWAVKGDLCPKCGSSHIFIDRRKGEKWCPFMGCDYYRRFLTKKQKENL